MGEIATQLTGVPPNDPTLEPYFALAEERDLPVLIHTRGIGPYLPGFRSAMGSPLLLEEVLVRHPKLRLFVENAGYPYRDDMIAMMTQYPQLHGDVSTISPLLPRAAFYDYLQALVRAGLGKRVMFGSDQMRWPEKIGEAIEAIEQAPFLTEEQKQHSLSQRRTLPASQQGRRRATPFVLKKVPRSRPVSTYPTAPRPLSPMQAIYEMASSLAYTCRTNYNPRRSPSVLKCPTLVGAASTADPPRWGPSGAGHTSWVLAVQSIF